MFSRNSPVNNYIMSGFHSWAGFYETLQQITALCADLITISICTKLCSK